MEAVVHATRALLASRSDEDERKALAVLATFVARDGSSWWAWLGSEPRLTDQLLVYVLSRAFASQLQPTSVFTGDALAAATAIPALSRQPGSNALEMSKLLERLVQTQWPVETLQRLDKITTQIEDPRVRQQAIQFGYTVLSHGCTHPVVTDQWTQQAIQVLLLGVTDVWSAVRKQSARSAVAIAFQFPALLQVDAFVNSLLKIANGDNWKAQEGALLTLTAILTSIHAETVPSSSAGVKPATAARTADLIKGASAPTSSVTLYHVGRHRGLTQLPNSLAVKLKPTLYAALKHGQLSVREAAALSFVRYVEICDEATRVLSFQEVMSKLNRLTPESSTPSPDDGVTQNVELLDAAEAEGLLDVLAKLVPHLPVAFLLKHWKFVFPTLERYVMHIASTVRLRSSAVVLALAELSLVESPSATPFLSIDLLSQMMLALAESRLDMGVCWQRLEGRLLSVDLLVGLLGRDRLWRLSTQQSVLHFVSRPRVSCSARGADAWLPDAMVVQATWTLDEDEEQRFKPISASSASVVERLNALAASKTVSASEMWQRILRGWIRQTHEAFDSTQFELRRIARQVLPGLVRLCMWCGMLPLLREPLLSTIADTKSSGAPPLDAWSWSCLRHAVLHSQLIGQSGAISSDTRDILEKSNTFVADTMRTARCAPATDRDEPEAIVARVEAILLANLSLGNSVSDSAWVSCALRDVHANIPSSFQHPVVASASDGMSPSSDTGSIDRQLSIALVPLLPVCSSRFVATRGDLTLWRTMERVALSWLATDDMFRWITIDKLTAQTALLATLRELLTSPEAEHALTGSGSDEVAFIVRTLESAVPVAKSPVNSRLVESLVYVYVSLWRYVVPSNANTRVQGKVITNLASIHYHTINSQTPAKSDAVKSEWDDWDGDDGSETPVDPKNQELRPTTSLEDPAPSSTELPLVVSVVNSSLSSELIDALALELRRLLTSGQPTVVHHHGALQSLVVSLESHSQQLLT